MVNLKFPLHFNEITYLLIKTFSVRDELKYLETYLQIAQIFQPLVSKKSSNKHRIDVF